MAWVCMYRDQLEHEGLLEEVQDDNLADVEVPDELLTKWYEEKLKSDYQNGFWYWLYRESVADDMDGFFGWTKWRPTKEQICELGF